jgi:hypothetical protein
VEKAALIVQYLNLSVKLATIPYEVFMQEKIRTLIEMWPLTLAVAVMTYFVIRELLRPDEETPFLPRRDDPSS